MIAGVLSLFTLLASPAHCSGAASCPSSMDAIQVTAWGEPEVLQVAKADVPQPAAGQLLVKVLAAGVNPVETYIRAGTYTSRALPPFPWTPGNDGAGIVEKLGEGVTGVAVGDRLWLTGSASGTYAQYCLCAAKQVSLRVCFGGERSSCERARPARVARRRSRCRPLSVSRRALPSASRTGNLSCAPLPPPSPRLRSRALLPLDSPACARHRPLCRTAYRALHHKAHARPGQTVLVHGASGGVGLAAVQVGGAGCERRTAHVPTPREKAAPSPRGDRAPGRASSASSRPPLPPPPSARRGARHAGDRHGELRGGQGSRVGRRRVCRCRPGAGAGGRAGGRSGCRLSVGPCARHGWRIGRRRLERRPVALFVALSVALRTTSVGAPEVVFGSPRTFRGTGIACARVCAHRRVRTVLNHREEGYMTEVKVLWGGAMADQLSGLSHPVQYLIEPRGV